MAVKKKTPVTKNSVISNSITTSISNLKLALENATRAVTERTAESRKLMLESRRLKKRRTAQMGRKKRAIAADRKNHTADSGKLVRTATSELAATDKALLKTTAIRQSVLAELSGLKESLKMLSVYVKGINAADRQLAMKNKRARRRAKPKAQ